MGNRAIDNRINRLRELEQAKKAIEEQINEVKAEIQQEMADRETMETTNYLIHWTKVISQRLDAKRLKEENTDIFNQFVKNIESRRFSYSAK